MKIYDNNYSLLLLFALLFVFVAHIFTYHKFLCLLKGNTHAEGKGERGKREKFKHNLYDLPMRQSRRGVPKMLFMARSMAREGRCCQLDCPRADGLFTPDFGLRTTTVCCLPIPAWLNRLPSGTHRRNSLGNNPWGQGRRRRDGDGSEWRQQSQWNFF